MTYRITGLDPAPFRPLFGLPDADLAARQMVRRVADAKPGYPCRITLEDAEPGEPLILLNHLSHDVPTPYRSSYAIFVREGAEAAAQFEDELPPVMRGRPLGLRGFDASGLLAGAVLALPGEADARLRALFARPEIATIHVHNAAHGCFVAVAERS